MNFNFSDFYISYPGHPNFNNSELVEDDIIRVIIQKYEMIIFTNKGELFGDLNFGADLLELLNETRLSSETIESDIKKQITEYIEEIAGMNYTLKVTFYEDPDRYQEYMEVLFQISEYDVFAVIG